MKQHEQATLIAAINAKENLNTKYISNDGKLAR
jgi:hypothetical protein